MKYLSTLIAVSDMTRSRHFYETLLGLTLEADLGLNVAYREGIALQEAISWADFIDRSPEAIRFGGNDAELYFETDALDTFSQTLDSLGVEIVHGIKEFPWGQRCIRFYDPDHHIVEAGENMAVVIRRFLDAGMSHEAIAERTGMSMDNIHFFLSQA